MRYNDRATDWAAARKEEQVAAHAGPALREIAHDVLRRLPAGPLSLVTLSAEGAALAGALVVLRDAPTSWRIVHLGRRMVIEPGAVLVEAVELAPGIKAALKQRHPDVVVFDGPVAHALQRVA